MKILDRFLDKLINTNEIEENSDFKEITKECEDGMDLKALEILIIIQNNISI